MKKIIILGLGNQGKKYLNFLYNKKVKVYVFEKNIDLAETLNKKYKNIQVVYDLNSFLKKNAKYNLYCFVALPTKFHAEYIELLSKYNCKILCEKPMFPISGIKTIFRKHTLKNKNNIFGGYILRSSLQIQELKNQITKNKSKIDYGFLYLSGTGSRNFWKHNTKMGGGVVNEIGSHLIDLCLYFFGIPKNVETISKKQLRKKREFNKKLLKVNSNDYAIYRFEYKNKNIIIKADFLSKKILNFFIFSGENYFLRTSITDKNLNENIKNINNNFYHLQINSFLNNKTSHLHKLKDTMNINKILKNEKKS